MVVHLLKALAVGIGTATARIATHLAFGGIEEFADAGVYAAGIAVFLASTILSYVVFE